MRFPNAMLPMVTIIAINLGYVVAGAITAEVVFNWPGLGTLAVDALRVARLPGAPGRVHAPVDHRASQMANVQVFNTKAISIRVAEMCVALGLSHSPLTYPRGKLAYQDFLSKV